MPYMDPMGHTTINGWLQAEEYEGSIESQELFFVFK